MEWAGRNKRESEQAKSSLWVLVPAESASNDPYFYVEMAYGEKRPRLIANREDVKVNSKIIATTRDADGYSTEAKSIWRIYNYS